MSFLRIPLICLAVLMLGSASSHKPSCLTIGWLDGLRLAVAAGQPRARIERTFGGPDRAAVILDLALALTGPERADLARFIDTARTRPEAVSAATLRRVGVLLSHVACSGRGTTALGGDTSFFREENPLAGRTGPVLGSSAVILAAGITYVMWRIARDARRARRIPCVLRICAEHRGLREAARLIDISQTGCRIRLSRPPAGGEALILHVAGLTFAARVVWTSHDLAGLVFDRPARASEVGFVLQAARQKKSAPSTLEDAPRTL